MAKSKTKEVTLERRGKEVERRKSEDRRKQDVAVAVERRSTERRVKQPRRRQIDPTTCERDYNLEEIEFMHAMDAYKRTSGRMFPTCSEILEVIRGLGYIRPLKLETSGLNPDAAESPCTEDQPQQAG
jgi:hypothetical protein